MGKLKSQWSEWTDEQWDAVCDYGILHLTAGNRMERREMLRPVAERLRIVEDDEFLAELEDRCKRHKTLDQEHSAEAEEKNVELDEGVLAVAQEIAGSEEMINARAAEAFRRFAAMLQVGLESAPWGWQWKRRKTKCLKAGQKVVGMKGAGHVQLSPDHRVTWQHGAILIQEADGGRVVECLAECQLVAVKQHKAYKIRRQMSYTKWWEAMLNHQEMERSIRRLIFVEWQPKMKKINLELIGQRALAGMRQWMPSAVGGVTQVDMARMVQGNASGSGRGKGKKPKKGSKQLQAYHETKFNERLLEVAASGSIADQKSAKAPKDGRGAA